MIKGTYIMKQFNYTDEYDICRVRVEIIGETEKSYRVRLLERGPKGQPIGTTYRPRKRNVIIDRSTEVRTSPSFEVRLPYKD